MHKPVSKFGLAGGDKLACQANKLACAPISRAGAGDHTKIPAPARHKPVCAGASQFDPPKKMSMRKLNSPFDSALEHAGGAIHRFFFGSVKRHIVYRISLSTAVYQGPRHRVIVLQ
ncbi:hypothetical protein FB45DRAFT_874347 [Roridomyces roridus]|uniref:Uncharacterized protein n=1 Tax=Roridomyces roridus TaxID=1738132 RepID=A0AAD7B8L6_9AGAR|nr:hypothetical protein FB45DRAFT_874347 [Roridomyces roridus]